jgi:hypothetical protein
VRVSITSNSGKTVAYDFQNQTTRIICKFLDTSQLKRQSRKSFTSNYPEATMTVDERIQMFEKRAEAIAANTPKLSFETFFNETSLEEAVDNELEILKRLILD